MGDTDHAIENPSVPICTGRETLPCIGRLPKSYEEYRDYFGLVMFGVGGCLV